MIAPQTLRRLFWGVSTAAALAFAGWIVVDTLRAVVPLWSPLPWFDEWATVELIRAWQDGDMTAADVLFAQHNEHRILLPRLVFFADDVLFRGGGYLSLVAIFAVQALHAGVFAAALARARPARPGRWCVAAVVLALMFSLRQAENFTSGFQLQFVAVFAGATLSFALFGIAVARERAGRASGPPLLASFAAVLLTTFTMANGLVAGFVLVVLALAARLRARIVVACAAWASILTAVYFRGYEPVQHHAGPADSLHHPLAFIEYLAAYLGNVATPDAEGWAAGLGLLGLASTGWATLRLLRRGRVADAPALAMVGVMLFVCATAAVTASGRLTFGIGQALSSRYATGSIAFWAAQLTYWWIDPPAWHQRFGTGVRASAALAGGLLGRTAAGVAAVALCWAVARQQASAKPQIAVQSFSQNHSADALLLGLDDPAATKRAAWSDEDVQRLLPTLKADGLSIFGTADAASIGRPVRERGPASETCSGGIASAVAEPALGAGAVRVSGSAAAGPRRRLMRQVLLADAAGDVRGLASGADPGAARGVWEGYAVAPVGSVLTAYGVVDGFRLCLIGSAIVTPTAAPPPQASQPEDAP